MPRSAAIRTSHKHYAAEFSVRPDISGFEIAHRPRALATAPTRRPPPGLLGRHDRRARCCRERRVEYAADVP